MFQLIEDNIIEIFFLIGNPIAPFSDQAQGRDLCRQRMAFERGKAGDIDGIVLFRDSKNGVARLLNECILIAENSVQTKSGKDPFFVSGIGENRDLQSAALRQDIFDCPDERLRVFRGFCFPSKLQEDMDRLCSVFGKTV